MRKPSLSVETFVTALAVLGAGTSLGCSKAPERASAAPETVAAPGAAAPPPPAETPPVTAPTAAAPLAAPAPEAENAPKKDKDKDKDEAAPSAPSKKPGAVRSTTAPPAKPAGSQKSPSAACGAGTCTPDMKKGSGN
jgi:fused signal recognition particle receptor